MEKTTTINRAVRKGVGHVARVAGTETSPVAFSVIKAGGKQYRVSARDIVNIEIMNEEHKAGDKIVFDQVLLTDNGTTTQVGAPFVAGAKVSGEIVTVDRGPKLVVMRYKQKSRSGPTKNGHRQPFIAVRIDTIA